MGDIEKIQVNALIDRYVMQVEEPLNSYYYNSSENNIKSKKRPSWAGNPLLGRLGCTWTNLKLSPFQSGRGSSLVNA